MLHVFQKFHEVGEGCELSDNTDIDKTNRTGHKMVMCGFLFFFFLNKEVGTLMILTETETSQINKCL